MHESSLVVVSFYTLDSPYEQEVRYLIDSCKRFSLISYIEGVSSFGSWELNCAHKPTFLLAALKHLQCPILWVDADAVFVQKPDFTLFHNCDIALRMNTEFPEDHHEYIYSGTIFVNNTPRAIAILEAWKRECEERRHMANLFLQHLGKDTYFWDQIALNQVLLANKAVTVKNIPIAYCKIFDNDHSVEPVIEHRQASRRFKDLI